MDCLYKLYVDYGRMGSLYGIFLATKEEMKDLIGTYLYFGEVLGKHSEVSFRLEEKHVRFITDDQDFIKKAQEYNLIPTGINPFNYVPEE